MIKQVEVLLIRITKKLKFEIAKINNPDELRELLICVYINKTSLELCVELFNTTEEIIIETLKEEKVYEYQICNQCNKLLSFSEFNNQYEKGNGYQHKCRECSHYLLKERRKDPKIQAYEQEYRNSNKELFAEWHREHNQLPEVKKAARDRRRERRRIDPTFRFRDNISTAMFIALKNKKEGKSIFEFLPYTFQDLMHHLEEQFEDNFTWDNYGSVWHLDHIVPCQFFEFVSYEDDEFQLCWSLKNLRPYPASLNVGAKRHFISADFGNYDLAIEFLGIERVKNYLNKIDQIRK